MTEFEVITLPTQYSERDATLRDYLLKRLAEIDRRAKDDARTILDTLAEIENRYPKRQIITPAAP